MDNFEFEIAISRVYFILLLVLKPHENIFPQFSTIEKIRKSLFFIYYYSSKLVIKLKNGLQSDAML
jgi:hypothetical protein